LIWLKSKEQGTLAREQGKLIIKRVSWEPQTRWGHGSNTLDNWKY